MIRWLEPKGCGVDIDEKLEEIEYATTYDEGPLDPHQCEEL